MKIGGRKGGGNGGGNGGGKYVNYEIQGEILISNVCLPFRMNTNPIITLMQQNRFYAYP